MAPAAARGAKGILTYYQYPTYSPAGGGPHNSPKQKAAGIAPGVDSLISRVFLFVWIVMSARAVGATNLTQSSENFGYSQVRLRRIKRLQFGIVNPNELVGLYLRCRISGVPSIILNYLLTPSLCLFRDPTAAVLGDSSHYGERAQGARRGHSIRNPDQWPACVWRSQ